MSRLYVILFSESIPGLVAYLQSQQEMKWKLDVSLCAHKELLKDPIV